MWPHKIVIAVWLKWRLTLGGIIFGTRRIFVIVFDFALLFYKFGGFLGAYAIVNEIFMDTSLCQFFIDCEYKIVAKRRFQKNGSRIKKERKKKSTPREKNIKHKRGLVKLVPMKMRQFHQWLVRRQGLLVLGNNSNNTESQFPGSNRSYLIQNWSVYRPLDSWCSGRTEEVGQASLLLIV